ncbi:superinfection immunity protein [Massilia sp. NP310]|nr:superinfection immunity protein [Massilia sp. NP310]
MENSASLIFGFVLLLAAVMFYFWPTLRARDVRHPAFTSIFIVNFLLGWLLIPWVIALAWAYRHKKIVEPSPDEYVKCPDCRELVKADANICKHCRCKLVPQ